MGFELTRERLPLTLPLDCGAKTTLKLALCPAARVSGRGKLPRLNGAVTVAWETVRLDPPELPRTSACVALLPAGTLPKFMLDWLTVSCAVATSAYRRALSRTRPHPITLHGKPGRFITSPSCAVLGHGRGIWSTAPSIRRERKKTSRLRLGKGATSASLQESRKIGRSQRGMLGSFLGLV